MISLKYKIIEDFVLFSTGACYLITSFFTNIFNNDNPLDNNFFKAVSLYLLYSSAQSMIKNIRLMHSPESAQRVFIELFESNRLNAVMELLKFFSYNPEIAMMIFRQFVRGDEGLLELFRALASENSIARRVVELYDPRLNQDIELPRLNQDIELPSYHNYEFKKYKLVDSYEINVNDPLPDYDQYITAHNRI